MFEPTSVSQEAIALALLGSSNKPRGKPLLPSQFQHFRRFAQTNYPTAALSAADTNLLPSNQGALVTHISAARYYSDQSNPGVWYNLFSSGLFLRLSWRFSNEGVADRKYLCNRSDDVTFFGPCLIMVPGGAPGVVLTIDQEVGINTVANNTFIVDYAIHGFMIPISYTEYFQSLVSNFYDGA